MSIYKSAITGEIVSKDFARKNPDTTFKQEINKEAIMAKTKKTEETKVIEGTEKTTDGQVADGTETPPNAPTPTQIIQTPGKPIITHESGRDQKVVRHDEQPGSLDSTTIVEEVVVHDEMKSDDREGQIEALKVLAATQGVNQSVVLGSKTVDGKKGNEVLTVFQDGTHEISFSPHVDVIEEEE